jgi:hypothetical protein
LGVQKRGGTYKRKIKKRIFTIPSTSPPQPFFGATNRQKPTQKWALQHACFTIWALHLEILPKAMVTKWQDRHNLATLKP